MAPTVSVEIFVDDACWGGIVLLVREALAIAGTLQARSADLGGSQLFQVRLAGLARRPVRSFTGPLIEPETTLDMAVLPQVVVVPPFFFADDERKPIAPQLRAWLLEAYDAGAIVVCMASGVRVLAETGLLDGRNVTGNLSDQRMFARHHPQVRFAPETALLIDGRIVSAGSINPCMDAVTYIVAQFVGETAAHKFARYTNSVGQPSYERAAIKHAAYKQHADQRVKLAQEFIERYFKQEISAQDAAQRATMSLRNFTRRFQQAVGMAAHLYIARCRVEHAMELLQQPGRSILQVALESGFRNEAAMRRAFDQQVQVTPTAYRAALRGNGG
ncbi:MAG: helix-turn-helix domain-containing protein [Pseudomonadota bacterium]